MTKSKWKKGTLAFVVVFYAWMFSGQPMICPITEYSAGGVLYTPYTSIDGGETHSWEHWSVEVNPGGLLDRSGFQTGDYLVGMSPDTPDNMGVRACEAFSTQEPIDYWVRRGGDGLPIAERPLIKLRIDPT